jgi:hypothetical protein
MGWRSEFDKAMKELADIKAQLETAQEKVERLEDPTVGLTALHGELVQSRLKILEKIEGGVTGLREENREIRRRQDRMISDLNDTRGELRQLLDLADVLRSSVPPRTPGESTPTPSGDTEQPPGPDTGDGLTSSAEVRPPASTDTEHQGGTMENTEHQPQPEDGAQEQDLVLKNAIEAAYQGTGTPAGQPPRGRTAGLRRSGRPAHRARCPAAENSRRGLRRTDRAPRYLGVARGPGRRPQPLPHPARRRGHQGRP